MCIIYLFPIFFVGMSISNIKQFRELPILLRFESIANLQWNIIRSYVIFVLQYAGIISVFLSTLFIFEKTVPPCPWNYIVTTISSDYTVHSSLGLKSAFANLRKTAKNTNDKIRFKQPTTF